MRRDRKLALLEGILRSYGSCLIAFSGGVDSTFLVKVASAVLSPERLLAVTAVSETYPCRELDFSRKIARKWGIPFQVIRTREFQDARFTANTPKRCFYCKDELFLRLQAIAARKGLQTVADASTVSDLDDYRPGNLVLKARKVCSPLREAGLRKEDVRALSRKMGLETWDKPSLACLASRIPYGTPLTRQVLKRVNQAELILEGEKLGQVRVRDYGSICRIEVSPRAFGQLLRRRKRLVPALRKLGYTYITLDLEGYRTGSMNEGLRRKKI